MLLNTARNAVKISGNVYWRNVGRSVFLSSLAFETSINQARYHKRVNSKSSADIVGILKYTYKPTLPPRFPIRGFITITPLRCSLSSVDQYKSRRDSEEGSPRERRCFKLKSS
jgi:hypothetical protein